MPAEFTPEHEVLVEVQVVDYLVRVWIALPGYSSRASIFHRGHLVAEIIRRAGTKAEDHGVDLDTAVLEALQQEEIPVTALQVSRDFGNVTIGRVSYFVPF